MAKGRKKVSFWATKKVRKPVRVRFRTRNGDVVSFRAKKKVPKRVKVHFYVLPKGRRRRRRRR